MFLRWGRWFLKPFLREPRPRPRKPPVPDAPPPEERPEFDFGPRPTMLQIRDHGENPRVRRIANVLFYALLFAALMPFVGAVAWFCFYALGALFKV